MLRKAPCSFVIALTATLSHAGCGGTPPPVPVRAPVAPTQSDATGEAPNSVMTEDDAAEIDTTAGGDDSVEPVESANPVTPPAPGPGPEPAPAPGPEPEPAPAPTPAPTNTPAPTPGPGPAPGPAPSPAPEPTPSPTPAPAPPSDLLFSDNFNTADATYLDQTKWTMTTNSIVSISSGKAKNGRTTGIDGAVVKDMVVQGNFVITAHYDLLGIPSNHQPDRPDNIGPGYSDAMFRFRIPALAGRFIKLKAWCGPNITTAVTSPYSRIYTASIIVSPTGFGMVGASEMGHGFPLPVSSPAAGGGLASGTIALRVLANRIEVPYNGGTGYALLDHVATLAISRANGPCRLSFELNGFALDDFSIRALP